MALRLLAVLLLSAGAITAHAQKYENFKVSSYIRAQDVLKMKDKAFLEQTWETVSSQVDLDKMYIETHRDSIVVDEKTLKEVIRNFMQLNNVAINAEHHRKDWQGTGNSFDYDKMMQPKKKGKKTIVPSTLASVSSYTLRQVDGFLGKLGNPVGIASYKPYHSSGEDFLQNYLGMIGLPQDMHPEFLQDQKQILLTQQAAKDPAIMDKIRTQLKNGGDVIVTTGLLKAIKDDLADVCELYCGDLKAIVDDFGRHGKSDREFIIPQVKYFTNDAWEVVSAGRPLRGGVSGYPVLLRNSYSNGTLYVLTIPDDFGNLYDYPEGALNVIRRFMSKGLDMYIEGPSKVALFPYDNRTFVVENFNDTPVSVKVRFNVETSGMENLETGEKVPVETVMEIPAHSYKAFRY